MIPKCRDCRFRQVREDQEIYRLARKLGVKCIHPEVRHTSPLFMTATTIEGRAGVCGAEGKFFKYR